MPAITKEKEEYAEKLNKLFDKYSKVMFVGVDHVTSQQIHGVRRDLRGKGVLLMGKKTLQKCIINKRAEKSDKDKKMADIFAAEQLLKTNRGLLFTDCSPAEINTIMARHRKNAPARVGAISPCDVIVPAGNTGMEPTHTSFFQALNIVTKINKGTVEIVTEKKVLNPGDRVDNSTAALLQKLNISPFFYEVELQYVFDRGTLFTAADLKTTDDDLEKAMLEGIANITAVSLGAGIPTEASYPHIVMDAFKNLLGFSVETNYEFDEFNGKKLRSDIKSGKAAPAAAAPAKKDAAPEPKKDDKKAPAKAAEPEEEEDFGMGGLF